MGSASSRRPLGGSSNLPRPPVPQDAKAWDMIYSESLPNWKYSAVLWGFEPRVDYTSNVKARLQPWCCCGRYFSVRFDSAKQIIERPYFLITITETCFKQDTYIRLPCAYQGRLNYEPDPSAAGHYLKAVQVAGYREGIAILQLNCVECMEFLVVHMKTGAVIGIHKEDIQTKHYMCDCLISPDLSSFIVKPNAMFVLNFCRGEYKNVMKVISCKAKDEHCPVMKTLFDGSAVRSFVAYDPRYRYRRIAMGNVLRNGRDVVCIYDTETEEYIAESDSSHYQTTHNIVFSPDGTYLASLILGRSVKDGLFNFPRVLVYSTTDLSVMHVVRTTFMAELPTLSPAGLFPLFSETGQYLAIAYGEQGTFYQQIAGVNVYKMPILMDLQSLCRLSIREFFDTQDVERLPLPSKLKAYLRFQPSYG